MVNGKLCVVMDGRKIDKQFAEALKLMTHPKVCGFEFSVINFIQGLYLPDYVTLEEMHRDPSGPIIKELYHCTEPETRGSTKCSHFTLKIICNDGVQVICQRGIIHYNFPVLILMSPCSILF